MGVGAVSNLAEYVGVLLAFAADFEEPETTFAFAFVFVFEVKCRAKISVFLLSAMNFLIMGILLL